MILKVKVHKDKESGFWGEVPALPGCVSQGETIDELMNNLKEAAEGWLEVSQEIHQKESYEIRELVL